MALQDLQNGSTYGTIRQQINDNFDTLEQSLQSATNDLNTTKQSLQSATNDLNTTKQNLQTATNDLNTTKQNLQTAEQEIDKLQEDMAKVNAYEKYVVVAIAGQSNAVGYDESPVANNLSYKNYNNNRIKQLGFYGANNLKLVDLGYCAESMQDMRQQNGKSEDVRRGTKGLHLPLANLMLDYIPDDYGVLVLPIAFGGTGFNSGNNGNYSADLKKPTDTSSSSGEGTIALKWGKDTAYYQTLRDRIKHALELNENNMFAGIIWCQGENDMNNAANHYTKFQEMTTALFDELNTYNGGALKNRTPKGTWDNDIWYNLETVGYWYGQGQCRIIWRNYKTWNSNTYIEVPRNTDSNLINGTGDTAGVRDKHYGNNAYQKVIAPLVLQKMIDMNTFSKKINITEECKDEVTNDIERVLVQDDLYSDANTTTVFTIDSNGKCTADKELPDTFTTDKSKVIFGDVYKLDWEVKRNLYWLIIERDVAADSVLVVGIGKTHMKRLSKIVGSTVTSLQNPDSTIDTTLMPGDRIRVYRNHDKSITVYRMVAATKKFVKLFDLPANNIYREQTLGFACGIGRDEFNGNFTGETTVLFDNMHIQKHEPHTNYKLSDVRIAELQSLVKAYESTSGVVNCTSSQLGTQVIPIVKAGSSTNIIVFQNSQIFTATKKYLPETAVAGTPTDGADSASGSNTVAWWTIDYSHQGLISYILK